jgi:hypothetical protein
MKRKAKAQLVRSAIAQAVLEAQVKRLEEI